MATVTPEMAVAALASFAGSTGDHSHSEAAIHRMAACSGAGAALATVLASPSQDVALRQLAGSVLREQIVKHRWMGPSTSEANPGPAVDAAEAAAVRDLATRALGDANRRVRTAAAQTVAAVGRLDWPARWPTLFDSLVAGAKGSGAAPGSVEQRRILDGSIRCLSYFAEGLSPRASVGVATLLLPHCLALADASSASPTALKRRSIAIVTELLQSLAAHSAGGGLAEVVALVEPGVPAILAMASSHLGSAGTSEAQFRVQAAIMHLLEVLANSFTTLVAPQADALVKTLFGFAAALLPLYVTIDVQRAGPAPAAVSDDADFGSDGEDVELEALVSRVLDTLVTVCSSESRVLSLRVRPWLKEVAGLCIGFAQLRDEDMELWLADAAAYVEDDAEDNTYSKKPRSTVLLLTQEIVSSHGQVGLRAVVEALAERGMPATALAASATGTGATAGAASGAWKVQEAALLVAGGVAPQLSSWWKAWAPPAAAAAAGGCAAAPGPVSPGGGKQPLPLKPEGVAAACYHILTADPSTLGVAGMASGDVKTVLTTAPGTVSAAQGLAFLRARALWTAARLGKAMTEAQATPFVSACLAAIGSESAMPIKIAACKALGMFTRRMKHASEALKASVPRSIEVLLPLLRACPVDILAIVLRPLVRAIRAGPEAAAAKSRDLATILVAMWIKLANHRDLGEELVFAIKSLVDNPNPSVAGMVAERFGPTLGGAIRSADATTSASATGAAEILRACLQHGPRPPPAGALSTIGDLLHGTTACEDRSVRIAASEAVAAMVFTAGGAVLGAESARDPRTGKTPLDAINAALASLLKSPDAAAMAASAADGVAVAAHDLPAMFAGVMAMAVAQTCASQIGAEGAGSLVQLVGMRACTVGMPSVSLRLCTAFCSFLAQNPGATIAACGSVTVPMPPWLVTSYKAAAPAGSAPVATSGAVPLLACVLLRVCALWVLLDAPLAQTVITMGLLRALSTEGVPALLSAVPVPAGAGSGRSGGVKGVMPLPQRMVQLVAQDLVERDASARAAMQTEWEDDDGAAGVAWGVDADEAEAAAAAAEARAAGKLGVHGVRYEDVADAVTGEDVNLSALAGAGMAGGSFMPADEMYMLSELIGADGVINAGMVGMLAGGEEDDDDGDSGFADHEGEAIDIDATQADDRDELWAIFHPLRGTDRSIIIRQFFGAASAPAAAGGVLAGLCSAAIAALPGPARDQFLAVLATAPSPAPTA